MEHGNIDNAMGLIIAIPFDCIFNMAAMEKRGWAIFDRLRRRSEKDTVQPGAREVLRTLVFDKSINVEVVTFVKGDKEAERQLAILESADLPVSVLHPCFKVEELRPLLFSQAIEYYYDMDSDRVRWAGPLGRVFSNWTELLFLSFSTRR